MASNTDIKKIVKNTAVSTMEYIVLSFETKNILIKDIIKAKNSIGSILKNNSNGAIDNDVTPSNAHRIKDIKLYLDSPDSLLFLL